VNLLVVSTNRNRLPMPVMPHGACLAAEVAERAGHRVRLLDLMFERRPAEAIRRALEGRPVDAVGVSVRNIDNNDLGAPVFFLRELGALIDAVRAATVAPIVLGGAAVGVMPEALLRLTRADCCVLGDAETVFPGVLERLSRNQSPGGLPGVGVIEGGEYRAAAAAPPAGACRCRPPQFRRWLDTRAYLSRLCTVPVQTKLGCHFACVYCTYRKIEGASYRLGDPGEVAEQVARLAADGLRHIEFVDNVFNSPRDHALGICEQLARRPHRASLQSLELNPLFVDDELFDALERAGFAGVGITVESAADSVLDGLGKGFTASHVHRAAGVVRRHRLPCVWIFMFGGPNETRETVRETLRFAETHVRRSDIAFFGCGIRVYPGTALESIARAQGVLTTPAEQMLEPVFYTSPGVDAAWVRGETKAALARSMRFMSGDSLSFRFLPQLHRVGYALGLRPPLWTRTAAVRRALRAVGMDV
jgi:radical SAM superfamily enzyme YgiQ (UPF0313 family)